MNWSLVFGLCASICLAIGGMIYFFRKMKQLQRKQSQLESSFDVLKKVLAERIGLKPKEIQHIKHTPVPNYSMSYCSPSLIYEEVDHDMELILDQMDDEPVSLIKSIHSGSMTDSSLSLQESDRCFAECENTIKLDVNH